jgi:excisionase family DNA binding protein
MAHDRRNTDEAHPKRRRWLTLTEAADYSGFSERTLRRRISDGTIAGYRAGPREIRVDAAELDKLFQPIPTAS